MEGMYVRLGGPRDAIRISSGKEDEMGAWEGAFTRVEGGSRRRRRPPLRGRGPPRPW